MTEKAEDLQSSAPEAEDLGDFDSKSVTLARALEEARTTRDTTIEIKGEMIAELERFRAAMRHELRERKRKFDLHDVLLIAGLLMGASGIAVAFHWSYSLIVVGASLASLSIVSLTRPKGNKTG